MSPVGQRAVNLVGRSPTMEGHKPCLQEDGIALLSRVPARARWIAHFLTYACAFPMAVDDRWVRHKQTCKSRNGLGICSPGLLETVWMDNSVSKS